MWGRRSAAPAPLLRAQSLLRGARRRHSARGAAHVRRCAGGGMGDGKTIRRGGRVEGEQSTRCWRVAPTDAGRSASCAFPHRLWAPRSLILLLLVRCSPALCPPSHRPPSTTPCPAFPARKWTRRRLQMFLCVRGSRVGHPTHCPPTAPTRVLRAVARRARPGVGPTRATHHPSVQLMPRMDQGPVRARAPQQQLPLTALFRHLFHSNRPKRQSLDAEQKSAPRCEQRNDVDDPGERQEPRRMLLSDACSSTD